MKTLGIVGGIGPESTVDYYRLLIERSLERAGQAPPLLIRSLDVARMVALFESGPDRDAIADTLLRALESLARGGADLGLIAANTPHFVFDQVEPRSPIPLISIVTATRDAAIALGLRAPALLGTRFTMQGGFYHRVFAERGLPLVTPVAEEVDYLHRKYIDELIPGRFLDETREGFLRLIARMRERDRIDGIILGGTELPLLLRGVQIPEPMLDTTRIHVEAAVERMLDGSA